MKVSQRFWGVDRKNTFAIRELKQYLDSVNERYIVVLDAAALSSELANVFGKSS